MNDRVAVVTGANRGIGFEICRQLAREGLCVVLTSRDETKGRAAVKALERDGVGVRYHPLDVTEAASVRALAAHLERAHGRLDVLVNNAGVLFDADRVASVLEHPIDQFHATMETNFYGPLRVCQALAPLLRKTGGGRIVNVSSGLGQLGRMADGVPAYRASKTALNALTRMLAATLRDDGILVNAMTPGLVRTDMGGPDAPRTVEQGADSAVWLALLPDGGPTGGLFYEREPVPW